MEDRFPTNYSILLTGPPGVGKFEYLVDRVRDDLRRGERVVFVTLDLHPSEMRARAKALHLDLDTVEGKSFVFVDCYSATSSERPPETTAGKKTFLVSSFSNLEGIGMAMSKAGQEIGTPVRIYFYTVSTLFLHNSPQAIAKFFQIVTSRAKTNLGFILYSVHEGVHEPMTMNLLRSLVDVEATSSQLLLPSHEKYHIDDIDNLANIREAIIAAMTAERPGRIVVDSMEFLMDRFPKEDVLRLWRELIEAARAAGTVSCFLFINWTLMERELDEIRAMSDFVVEFQSSLRGGIVRNSMRISQMESNGIRTNWIPYTFKDLVGLTVYFPRILVTGPFNAGKSTVVKAVSEKSISIDRMGTTVAFDYGNVNITGIEAEIFGTPGQERFEFIFKIFAREVSGVLLVVDASHPDELVRARQMLDLVGPRIPYVVLANKSDLPGAIPPEEIAHRMSLPEDVPVIPTVATENKGVRDALLILAEMIIGVR